MAKLHKIANICNQVTSHMTSLSPVRAGQVDSHIANSTTIDRKEILQLRTFVLLPTEKPFSVPRPSPILPPQAQVPILCQQLPLLWWRGSCQSFPASDVLGQPGGLLGLIPHFQGLGLKGWRQGSSPGPRVSPSPWAHCCRSQ